MTDFGIECMRTRRYDTTVPEFGIEMLDATITDTGSAAAALGVKPFIDAVIEACEEYADEPELAAIAAGYRSRSVALLWRSGQYTEARQVLERLGGVEKLSPKALVPFGARPVRLAGSLYALTSERANEIKRVEQLASAGTLPPRRKFMPHCRC